MEDCLIRGSVIVNQKSDLQQGEKGILTAVAEGIILYPNEVIPLIIDEVGCLGTVRINSIKYEKGQTIATMSLVESAMIGDCDKMEDYYRAYTHWKADNKAT